MVLRLRRARWYRRTHARILAQGNPGYERMVADRKRALFRDISGTVLEIGPGGGVNFPYYPPGTRWIGVEPNAFLHGILREKGQDLGIEADFGTGVAERIDAPDESVDAVVSTLVLCSVGDVRQSLREVLRVLRPGGRFYFVEHVAAPRGTRLRRVQEFMRPAWGLFTDGCRPDRETWADIEAAGFAHVDYEPLRLPIPIVGPHIVGTATKAG